jgi:membrane-bound lytic murein transglycosylase F
MLALRKLTFVITLVLITFSCNQPAEEGFVSLPKIEFDLNAIVKRGYITALVDNNSTSYFIYKGQPMGYEYELLKLLASHLNVALKIKVTSGIENAIERLNNGEGDILAFPLTVTKNRTRSVAFTKPHFNVHQVLVQRKPKDWQKLSEDEINEQLIKNPYELVGKEVHVIEGTSFELRMKHLSEEVGGDILLKIDTPATESESLIRKVATGEIQYTVTDHMTAQVNSTYYANIDVRTILSLAQQIAWAVRKNSPSLLDAINTWLSKIKKEATFMVIYNRYFKSPRTSSSRMRSDYYSYNGEKLSPYDELIKDGAKRLDWDWLLLAAVVYQESKFMPSGESWAGARGLMQLMPATAKRFGAKNLNDPVQSVKAGVGYLRYLDRYWTKTVPDKEERLNFVLASYNAGLSHIVDASKLCKKYGKNPAIWKDNVELFLLKKSNPKYYRDRIVVAGYCKCEEPVNYVNDVRERYEEYKIHLMEIPGS